MKLRHVMDEDRAALCALWNRAAPLQGYAALTEQEMDGLILRNKYFDPAASFVLEDGALHGFGSAASAEDLPGGAKRGYLCFAVTDRQAGEAGHRLLMDALEQALRARGCECADVLFFNPIRLPWVIPGTPGHRHNNVPGLWVECEAYGWMLARGYAERTRECAMYLPLGGFSLPKRLLARQQALEREGLRVAPYDGRVHKGLAEMLQPLGNAEWQAEITGCARTGTLFLVALCGAQTVGFAGPVYPQPDGRGYFTGIGVIPAYEGRGLGTLLFNRMCLAQQEAGAKYLSLFTGEKNPARHIYEQTGFKAVRSFGILRKAL